MYTQRKLRRSHAWAVLLLAFVVSSYAATDISDTPLATKNNAPPNFMYMIDSSASMSNIVPEAPYTDATTYLSSCSGSHVLAGGFTDPTNPGTTQYDIVISSSGTPSIAGALTANFGSADSNKCFDPGQYYVARLLGDTASGTNRIPGSYPPAVYKGNYLNWYFGAPSSYSSAGNFGAGAQRKPGTQTRLEIAKTAAKATLASLPLPSGSPPSKPKARIGLSSYSSGGGLLLKNVSDLDSAATVTAINTAIDSLVPNGATPLSETLTDIGQYFTLGYTGNLTLHPDSASPSTASVSQVFKQGTSTPHTLSMASGVTLPSSGCTGTACPIQYWCQRSYAIVMTGGRAQDDRALSSNTYLADYDGDCAGANAMYCTGSYDMKKPGSAGAGHPGHVGGFHSYASEGSDYLDDVAQALYEIDLRPDLAAPSGRSKKNNVRTYTIGFAHAQGQNDPLLQETAAQGGGLFLTASDTPTLSAAFSKATADALAKDGASASVAVVNAQIMLDNIAYASSYNSGMWTGDLNAYSLDTTTGLPILPAIWSAQPRLDSRTQTNRNIVTYDGTVGVVFDAANTGVAANLVNYLRGDRSNEGTSAGYLRVRAHLLGDIVNAEPVVVKYGTTPIVYQGANDGMLHVFTGCGGAGDVCAAGVSPGDELWAYIPKLIRDSGKLNSTGGGLADQNYAHYFFVDATPAVADVTVSGTTTKLLVGGLGAGGNGYYALDITNPSAASESAYATKVMWEALGANASMGYGYGTPLVVNTPSDGWLVLVTSGYNNSDGSGKLFALDPLTGAIQRTIDTGAGSPANPAGLAYIAKLNSAAASDVIGFVYGGDLLGNVWRFDLTNWTATRIAVLRDGSGNTQPVSSAPAVGSPAGMAGRYYAVYVGTGLYLGDSDIPGNTPVNSFATQTQSYYGIIDDTSLVTPTLPVIRGNNGTACPVGGGNGDFVCQSPGSVQNGGTQYTNTDNAMTNLQKGWYFDIPITNGRNVTPPQLTSGGALAMTVNIPTNQICDPGGTSWFANVNAANGGAIEKTFGAGTYYPSIDYLGAALASRAVVVITADGKRAVIRMSDQSFRSPSVHEPPLPPPLVSPTWKRIYWRELM